MRNLKFQKSDKDFNGMSFVCRARNKDAPDHGRFKHTDCIHVVNNTFTSLDHMRFHQYRSPYEDFESGIYRVVRYNGSYIELQKQWELKDNEGYENFLSFVNYIPKEEYYSEYEYFPSGNSRNDKTSRLIGHIAYLHAGILSYDMINELLKGTESFHWEYAVKDCFKRDDLVKPDDMKREIVYPILFRNVPERKFALLHPFYRL